MNVLFTPGIYVRNRHSGNVGFIVAVLQETGSVMILLGAMAPYEYDIRDMDLIWVPVTEEQSNE
jgi:hypothetical protein